MNDTFRFLGVIGFAAGVVEQSLNGPTLASINAMTFGCACLLIALTIFPKQGNRDVR